MCELVRISLSVDSLDGRRVAVVVDHIEMRHCTDTLGSKGRNMWAVREGTCGQRKKEHVASNPIGS